MREESAVEAQAERALDVLHDPTRRHLLQLLRNGECSVRELTDETSVSQPAVSQHLRVLKDAGLVTVRPQGTRRFYRVDPNGLGAVRAWVDSFWDDALDAFVSYTGATVLVDAEPIQKPIQNREKGTTEISSSGSQPTDRRQSGPRSLPGNRRIGSSCHRSQAKMPRALRRSSSPSSRTGTELGSSSNIGGGNRLAPMPRVADAATSARMPGAPCSTTTAPRPG